MMSEFAEVGETAGQQLIELASTKRISTGAQDPAEALSRDDMRSRMEIGPRQTDMCGFVPHGRETSVP